MKITSRFIILVFSLLSFPVFAAYQSVAPTQSWSIGVGSFPTAASACASGTDAESFTSVHSIETADPYNRKCWITQQIPGQSPYRFSISLNLAATCPDSSWNYNDAKILCEKGVQCTGGQTENAGGTCSCPGVQTLDSSDQCRCDPNTLGRFKGVSVGGSGSMPASICHGGCSFGTGGVMVGIGSGASAQWGGELGSPLGSSCTGTVNAKVPEDKEKKEPPKDDRTPEQKCLGAGQGFITTSSGTSCTSAKDSPEPLKTKKIEETVKTGPDGPLGTQTKTTECFGSSCVTKTVDTDGTGAVKTTTTEGGGGGGSGDELSECEKNPDTVGCMKPGEPPNEGALDGSDRGVGSISVQSFASSSGCPAPLALPHGASLSFQWSCDMASTLRPLILALAWLSAGLIVMGAFKGS